MAIKKTKKKRKVWYITNITLSNLFDPEVDELARKGGAG